MFIRNQRGTWQLKWHVIENVVSNQQSFTDHDVIDRWRDCFNAYLKAKSKHFELLLWCFFVTFKAYFTAAINKLTCVSFRKVEWSRTAVRRGGNSVAVMLQIYFSICQWCDLRPRSCDKTGLTPTKTGLGFGLGLASLVLVLILVLQLWSWQLWSYRQIIPWFWAI